MRNGIYGKLSPRREKFINLIVFGQKSQKDAYAEAYGRKDCSEKTLTEKASKLAAKLALNINALRLVNAEYVKYDAEKCYTELEALRTRNITSTKNQSVVARAIELKMRLCGLVTERHEVTGSGGSPLGITLFTDKIKAKEHAVCQ
jgi:hypothetical protein